MTTSDAACGRVALTFDDGPDPTWTPRLLDALAAADVRATFFVIGEAVAAHPDPVRRARDEGHEVQLHCWRHARHTTLDRAALEADTDAALASLRGLWLEPTLWRTPWGVRGPHTEAVAEARGLELVGWTADTKDWAGEPAAVLLQRVAGALRPGAVVLSHDGLGPGALRAGCAETVALVAPLAAAVRATGLEPGPLTRQPASSAVLPRRGRGAPALGVRAGLGSQPA